MRLVAAAAVTLVAALGCAGCGVSGAGNAMDQTITITLPGARVAADVIGHVATGNRRISAHPRSGGPTSVIAPATPAAAVVRPLTPVANARLNGVGVWVPYWGGATAVSDAIDNAAVVKVAHPFMDEITGSSTVVDQSGGQAAAISSELAAGHLDVIPTVTETAEMGAFGATLASRKKQAALLKSLEAVADQPGNDGIDLDFENMAIGSGGRAEAEKVQSRYPTFVARLCAVLHRTDRSCEVTVMAKNNAGMQAGNGLNTGVYDYSALGAVADRVQIMAYDDHVPSGASGPIAPWPWVESVINYATTQIPADKIVLGVPAYGYDWSSKGGGTSLTATAALALASQVHAAVRWNAADAEPYFTYAVKHTTTKLVTRVRTRTVSSTNTIGVTTARTVRTTVHLRVKLTHRTGHIVWFEDSTADYDRAVLAADDKLAGIAIWAGGDESPGLWSMLARLK